MGGKKRTSSGRRKSKRASEKKKGSETDKRADGNTKEKRTRIMRAISQIPGELANLTTSLANQFVAFVSKKNRSGDLGGLSTEFSEPVRALTLLGANEITSIDFESGETQKHLIPIRSIKGGYVGDNENSLGLGSLGVLLADGRFFVGGGPSGGRKGRGNLREFSGLSDVKIKKISAGLNHFLMLSDDGRVFSIISDGMQNEGQLGSGNTTNHHEPFEIEGLPKIRKIRSGWNASSFVDVDGNLWVCGSGWGKIWGFFPFEKRYKNPTKIESDVKNVFSGFASSTTFIQKTDGRVLAGGQNSYGQCGVGRVDSNLARWTEIKFEDESYEDIVKQGALKKISCSGDSSFLLLKDGTIFACGRKGESGFKEDKTVFTKLNAFEGRGERVLDFSCGDSLSAFLTDSGKIYMVGRSENENIRHTLRLFGKSQVNSATEEIWEVAWKNEQEREDLRKMISEGRQFKVSIWQGESPDVFITEKGAVMFDRREEKKEASGESPEAPKKEE